MHFRLSIQKTGNYDQCSFEKRTVIYERIQYPKTTIDSASFFAFESIDPNETGKNIAALLEVILAPFGIVETRKTTIDFTFS